MAGCDGRAGYPQTGEVGIGLCYRVPDSLHPAALCISAARWSRTRTPVERIGRQRRTARLSTGERPKRVTAARKGRSAGRGHGLSSIRNIEDPKPAERDVWIYRRDPAADVVNAPIYRARPMRVATDETASPAPVRPADTPPQGHAGRALRTVVHTDSNLLAEAGKKPEFGGFCDARAKTYDKTCPQGGTTAGTAVRPGIRQADEQSIAGCSGLLSESVVIPIAQVLIASRGGSGTCPQRGRGRAGTPSCLRDVAGRDELAGQRFHLRTAAFASLRVFVAPRVVHNWNRELRLGHGGDRFPPPMPCGGEPGGRNASSPHVAPGGEDAVAAMQFRRAGIARRACTQPRLCIVGCAYPQRSMRAIALRTLDRGPMPSPHARTSRCYCGRTRRCPQG